MSYRNLLTTAFLLLGASACAPALLLPLPSNGGPSVSGRVIDTATHRPIEGAVVLAYWKGVVPIKGSHVCVHVETATTFTDGTFSTAAWTFPRPVVYTEPDFDFQVYKSGMIFDRESLTGHTLELVSFPGNREARLKELQHLSRSANLCANQPVSIADLKDAIAAEMASLVTTPEETRIYVDEAKLLARSARDAAARYERWIADGAKE